MTGRDRESARRVLTDMLHAHYGRLWANLWRELAAAASLAVLGRIIGYTTLRDWQTLEACGWFVLPLPGEQHNG